jgi:hypothetical protein
MAGICKKSPVGIMAESGGGGEEFVFEPTVFCDAVTRLYSRWEAHGAEEGWGSNADAIAIVSGASQEDVITFPKSLALHAGELLPPPPPRSRDEHTR